MPRRIPDDFDLSDFAPRRRPLACVCGGESVGPCPGPLNCPNSGLGPEEDEIMTYKELLAHVQEFFSDTNRSRAETKDALENLEFEIQEMIETLDDADE